jgi:hypothetical protein
VRAVGLNGARSRWQQPQRSSTLAWAMGMPRTRRIARRNTSRRRPLAKVAASNAGRAAGATPARPCARHAAMRALSSASVAGMLQTRPICTALSQRWAWAPHPGSRRRAAAGSAAAVGAVPGGAGGIASGGGGGGGAHSSAIVGTRGASNVGCCWRLPAPVPAVVRMSCIMSAGGCAAASRSTSASASRSPHAHGRPDAGPARSAAATGPYAGPAVSSRAIVRGSTSAAAATWQIAASRSVASPSPSPPNCRLAPIWILRHSSTAARRPASCAARAAGVGSAPRPHTPSSTARCMASVVASTVARASCHGNIRLRWVTRCAVLACRILQASSG